MNVEPLRHALLEQARSEAERALAEAEERAVAVLAEAERQGGALVERGRADGLAAAELEGVRGRARSRRRARSIVLAARREAYEALVAESVGAALGLRERPGYQALLERLGVAARARLGPDAQLEPDPEGGLVARAGGRLADYRLETLARRCVGRLGARIEELWT